MYRAKTRAGDSETTRTRSVQAERLQATTLADTNSGNKSDYVGKVQICTATIAGIPARAMRSMWRSELNLFGLAASSTAGYTSVLLGFARTPGVIFAGSESCRAPFCALRNASRESAMMGGGERHGIASAHMIAKRLSRESARQPLPRSQGPAPPSRSSAQGDLRTRFDADRTQKLCCLPC